MCFSATASFSAGAVLLGLGALTLKSARRPRELLYAAIPLLFAIQQLSEGVIWLTFRYETPQLNVVMTHVYSFFSHVKNAQERALDHRSVVYAQRERTEPLPGRPMAWP